MNTAIDWPNIKPQIVTKVDMVLGGEMSKLLPPMSVIPKEFQDMNPHLRDQATGAPKWLKVFSDWFYGGLPKTTEFIPKPGIDGQLALRHIASIMRSFDPQHEHKTAGCAWLLSLWFEDVKY